uniref:Uncharacterized protein n=1 Tax=viral metagenome TaxID=1070528 RepID=A0A2V0RA14_9ZZZZ
MPAIWIAGPSGSGKTTLANKFYFGSPGIDLDVFGVRIHNPKASSGWDWYVDPRILVTPVMKGSIVAAGIMSNWREIAQLPWDAIVYLYGDAKVLAARGVERDARQRRPPQFCKSELDYRAAAVEWMSVTASEMLQLGRTHVHALDWGKGVGALHSSILGIMKAIGRSRHKPKTFDSIEEVRSNVAKIAT